MSILLVVVGVAAGWVIGDQVRGWVQRRQLAADRSLGAGGSVAVPALTEGATDQERQADAQQQVALAEAALIDLARARLLDAIHDTLVAPLTKRERAAVLVVVDTIERASSACPKGDDPPCECPSGLPGGKCTPEERARRALLTRRPAGFGSCA